MNRASKLLSQLTSAAVFLVTLPLASAIEPCELAKLTPSAGSKAGIGFADSVAIGDFIVVGDYDDDEGGNNAGAVYIYERAGTDWLEPAKVLAWDASFLLSFGVSVGIENDLIVVGAIGTDFFDFFFPGAAYIVQRTESDCCAGLTTPGCDRSDCADQICLLFPACCETAWDDVCAELAQQACPICRDPWIAEVKLSPSGTVDRDYFGSSVSVGAGSVLVGAFGVARAYVFRHDGMSWVEEAALAGSDSHPGDWFGHPVGISRDTAVVGAMFSDRVGEEAGAVYVFRQDGDAWTEDSVLAPSDTPAFGRFGRCVAIDGDTIAVGAFFGVYMFRRTEAEWVEETILLEEDRIGSVALDDDLLVVGPGNTGSQPGGTAHAFRRVGSTWVLESSFEASDSASTVRFGVSAAVADGVAVIGSDGHAAYVFAVADDCNTTGLADACDIASETSVDCDDDLVPDECQPDCDKNGVADSCDIADGRLEDANADGIPDVCLPVEIPASSAWGLIATALLLLVCAKLYFERREMPAGMRRT